MAQKTNYGNWKVRWRDKGEGVMRSRNFVRKFDAEKFEAELKLGMKFNMDAKHFTSFREFGERWLKEYSQVHKSQSQQKEDLRLMRDYFLPNFGDIKLKNLTKSDLVRFQAALVHAGKLKPKSINNITGTARKILQDAYDWDLIKGNPWGSVKPLKVPEQPFKFWTFAEAERFLTFCKSRDYALYEYVAFALNTGLRKGEIEGLLRDSVDFDRRQILVRRTYNNRVPTKLQLHTKSKKMRWVEMNSFVLDLLKDRKLLAPNQRIFVPKELERFKAMAKKAGVSVISIHDLRHTFASHLVMRGEPLIKVQVLLGHSESRMTQRYAHLAPGFMKGSTECLVPPAVPPKVLEVVNSLDLQGQSTCPLPGSNHITKFPAIL